MNQQFKVRVLSFLSIVSLLVGALGIPTQSALAAPQDVALQFDGTNDYVTFGASQGLTPPGLGVQVFTIETWFKRTGNGVTVSTGTGGLSAAIPLVTKGRGEGDGQNVDMNYFFGIDSATGRLAADFEECAPAMGAPCPSAASAGLNHPALASTVIQNNIWYHAAVTFDGQNWNFYLNGVQDGSTTTLPAARYPRWDSIQHAGIGTALTSSAGAGPAGYFQGVIDEVRIWNVVRTQAEIQADMNNELTSGTGLVGRWGLNEGTGTTVTNSIVDRPNGTLTNGPVWVTTDLTPPAAPTGLAASPYSGGISLAWAANTEPDLAGYNLYRSTTTGGPYTKVNTTLITVLTYADGGLINGTPYSYVLRAVDASSNESGNSVEVTVTPGEQAMGLNFDGTNDYVTFGNVSGLGLTDFTLETWFYWTGGGVATTTSTTQGLPSVIPLVTKGRGEADGSSVDMNYFLGVVPTTNKLAADFEDMATGLNHPFTGSTTITTNAWHHAAVTYDSTNAVWALYLDGVLDSTLDIGSNVLPRSDSIQHAGIASAMTSTGTAAGFFQGRMDEVRIWNVVRTEAEIMATINSELTSGTGLVARWGLNEGGGSSIASSVGTFPGTLTNGPTWVAGAPFNIAPPSPPAAPTLLAATPTAGLQIDLSWTDNSANETSFKVERSFDGSTGWGEIGTTNTNVTTFSNAGLDPATQYCYRVRASNSSGDSEYSNVSCATTPGEPNNGLDLGSSSSYVSVPTSSSLNTSTFTIETWFRRDGTGLPVTTGTGGVTTAIPLLAKGTSEAENSGADINYFLAVENATGRLCADFEEAPGGASPSQNHPVCGTTTIVNGTWYHAAAAYDGTTWQLYLNGNLEATLTVSQPANAVNTALFAMGTSITTTGTAQGFFDGALDEVRVWNYPRTQADIQGTMNSAITSPQTGLVARWALNESTGTAVPSSAGTSVNGTITGAGYSWGAGAPAIVHHDPAVVLDSPGNGATNVLASPTLSATVSDPDLDEQTVSFYGRPKNPAPAADFTIAVLPDTQHYTDNPSNYANYSAQTQWIVANKDALNIQFVTHLGDIVEHGNNNGITSEWEVADAAMALLEDPLTTLLTHGIPYGLAPGNHDQGNTGDGSTGQTAMFNTYFGVSRFQGRGYYGGHYGAVNDNNYDLFSAGGMDFIVVHFEYDTTPDPAVLSWADGLLQTYSDRRAIAVTHWMINGGDNASFSAQGQAIYNALKDNPNLFLLLGGHVPSPSEGRRTDTYLGNTVNSLMSDYQSRPNGGNGWMRLMTFSPANNIISIKTYSPVLNQYEADADSEFTLSYTMTGAPAAFQLIGTDTAPSGGTASVDWNGLANGTEYEWYAETTDGVRSATSATYSFTTDTGTNQAPVIAEGETVSVTMSEDGAPTAFNLTLHASDADAGDTLTWSVSTPASNGIASATGTGLARTIGFTPNANFNGSDSFVVQVLDGHGGMDTITVNITVEAVNDVPQVTNPGAQTNTEGDTVSLQIQASDVDLPAQTLTYSASNLPAGLSIHPASGLISGAIDLNASASSPYAATVTVSDGAGGSAPVDFSWTVSDSTPPAEGLTCTTLQPKPATTGTGEKPQSKVWYHDAAWWAVFPTNTSGASSAGTWLWKLEGTAWTEVLKLSDRTDVKADAKLLGDATHILLYAGINTQLVSVEYSNGTYQLWASRPAPSPISLSGSEIATIDIDSTGRMWLATENSTNEIIVYHSASPYSAWQGPIILGTGVSSDDIAVVTAFPNKIGVLWSNQNTQRFGFRVHNDSDDATTWAADEVPASQSAQNVGLGMADDHLNLKVASDGTLYAAVKTSYDTANYTKLALLVRRPSGAWDDLYHVDYAGTRGNIELDEVNGVLTYLYTQAEGYNPIVYRQSQLSPIAFGEQQTLRSESFNDVSSTKQSYNNEIVVIYGSSTQVGGQICTGTPASGADLAITKDDGLVSVQPNEPITYTVTLTNNGPESVTGATVADTMPVALTNVSWTCTASGGATCTSNGTGDINDIVNVPVGGLLTYSISATVNLGARGNLSNTVTVSPPGEITDPVIGNNTATDTDAIGIPTAACENDPNLVGCWQMEEGGGSVLIDGSSFNHDASVSGAPAWVTGKVGTYSLDLNGTSQYASVPDDTSLDITNQITMAAWIKPEEYDTADLIKKATNGGINGYELSLATTKTDDSSRKVFFRINQVASGDTYRVNSTTVYPIDGTWMHVAATFDGTTLRMYINGQLESSVDAGGQTIATNNLPLTIGAQDGTAASRWFMGWIDEARIYNRALSLAEIQSLAGITTYALTVDKTGTGTGLVTSVPAGIDCGGTCSFDFSVNTVVTLTATPVSGSTFNGWSGPNCSGTSTCVVTMDAAKSVTANFESAVSLISPSGTLTSWNNVFSWTGTSGADFYQIEVSDANDAVLYSQWYTTSICTGLDCAVSPAETLNLANGSYKWKVRTYGSSGFTAWTDFTVFTLDVQTLSLTSPTGTLTSWNNVFSWTGISTADFYQLEVYDGSDTLVYSQWYTTNICTGLDCVVSPAETQNLANGSYKWKVRTYGSSGFGDWTPFTDFTLNVSTLSLISPSGTLTGWNNVFSWTGTSGADFYQIEVSDSSDVVLYSQWYTTSICTGLDCAVSPAETLNLANGSYKWKVRTYGSSGFTAWTDFTVFTLDVQTLSLISPSGTLTSWNNVFSWTGISTADFYQIEVSDTSDAVLYSQWYTTNICTGLDCVVSPAETRNLANGDYKWKVRTYGSSGFTA